MTTMAMTAASVMTARTTCPKASLPRFVSNPRESSDRQRLRMTQLD